MIPEGITHSRTFRFYVARPPATPTRPSRSPWLAIGLCCPGGSSLTTASSAPLNPSPPLRDSRRSLLYPRKSASGGNPEGPQCTPLDCARVPPPLPRWSRRVRMTVSSPSVLAFTSQLRVRRPQWSFRGCRVHSELIGIALMLRPASWLALLSRTFTFELSLAGSPRTNVEYNYVDKQSVPTTGFSPASPTALWAAEPGLTPWSFVVMFHSWSCFIRGHVV